MLRRGESEARNVGGEGWEDRLVDSKDLGGRGFLDVCCEKEDTKASGENGRIHMVMGEEGRMEGSKLGVSHNEGKCLCRCTDDEMVVVDVLTIAESTTGTGLAATGESTAGPGVAATGESAVSGLLWSSG